MNIKPQYAHAARIDDDGTVVEVIVIPHMDNDDSKITEYCNSIGLRGTWLDTSYLGARRGRYAGIDYTYNSELDEFIAPAVAALTLDEISTVLP